MSARFSTLIILRALKDKKDRFFLALRVVEIAEEVQERSQVFVLLEKKELENCGTAQLQHAHLCPRLYLLNSVGVILEHVRWCKVQQKEQEMNN
jgi:hypothetical protein